MPAAATIDSALPLIPATMPLALLPVRLETRFSTENGKWLLVRIFPDDIHIDQRKEVRPAVARLLPDSWIALGYRDASPGTHSPGGARFVVRGKPITPDLPVVPDPTKMGARDPSAPITSQVDPQFRWVTDFAAAEEAGMALRIAIDDDILTNGLDRLVVLGVRNVAGDEAQRFVDQLKAHEAGDSLSFLPAGSPTNNTAEASAGAIDVPTAPQFRDGQRVEWTMGLPNGSLANVAHGDSQQLVGARWMNALLWPVTWRYFLEQMMVTAGGDTPLLTPFAVEWLRVQFVGYVRADGPLPTLRVGRQPYGILPVTTIDQWPAGDDPIVRFTAILKSLRNRLFVPALSSVPRVDGTRMLDESVQQILLQQAHSYRYSGRPLLGAAFLRNLAALMRWEAGEGPMPRPTKDAATWAERPDPPAAEEGDHNLHYEGARAIPPTVEQTSWDPADSRSLFNWVSRGEQTATQLLREVLGDVGLSARPRLGRGSFLVAQFPIDPLVAHSIQADLAALNADAVKVADLRGDFHPKSLLEALSRQAVLLECAAALRHNAPWLEQELMNIGMMVAMLPGPPTVGEVRAIDGANGLRELNDALTALAQLPPDELSRLASGTLDLCSHRLDAWITSLATRRIDELRAHPGRTKGLFLGGYGWVTDLRPQQSAPLAPDEVVHAPSLAHATTAAILRAGYQAHRDDGGALAVDLSSARVRRAQWLLDGVRAGQSPSALLGYNFERGLAEREQPGRLLRQYVAPLRRLAPLTASLALPSGPREATAAHDVVDGIALSRIWRANRALTPLPLGATASFEARIFVTQVDDDYATIAGKHAGDNESEYLFGLRKDPAANDGFLCLAWHTAGAGAWPSPAFNVAQTIQKVPLNRWVHVAAVRDHGAVSFYIDGRLVPSSGAPDTLPFRVGASHLSLRLGSQSRPNPGQRTLRGRLREVRLWNVARSAEEIQRGSTGALLAVEAGLAGYWRFDEITEEVALDRSPYGNHGTFVHGQPPWVTVTDDPNWLGGDAALELGGGAFVEIAHQPLLSLGPIPGLPSEPTDQVLVAAALDQLLDDADAASDLTLAESIHQVALGNASRAAATLESMSGGTVPPPELEVLRTPRGAVNHTQRVMVWLSDGGNAAAAWHTDDHQLRASLEPLINEWAARLLGSPERSFYQVDFLDAAGQVLSSSPHHLGDLQLSALDFVHLPPGELEARIRVARAADVPQAAQLRIQLQPALGADQVSALELVEMAAALKRVLVGARPMTGADLMPPTPGEVPADLTDPQDLPNRVARVTERLTRLRGRLEGDTLADALVGLSYCGIPGCVATPGAELPSLGRAAVAEVNRRLARAQDAGNDAARLAALLGDGFRVAPRLALTGPIRAALAEGLHGGRPGWNGAEMHQQLWRWLSAHARVREPLSALDDLLLYDTALNGAAAALAVAQLPLVAGEPWVGMAPANAVAASRLSLVMVAPPDSMQLAAGLVLDEWVDSVPKPMHTTGVTFHCDAPGAAPPHSILLAVPPDERSQWDVAGLEAVLRETMELLRVRMVGPRALGPAGQFLPATLVPFNTANETISTNLTVLAP